MAKSKSAIEQKKLNSLLLCDHTLPDGILFGIDGYIIEIQARAVRVLGGPCP